MALRISKNKILVVALIVVAVVGYYMFKGPEKENLTTVETGAPGTIGQELVVEINRLKALQNLEGKLFNDSAFVSLQDYTQTVMPQPLGRNNPFAPIGNVF